MKPVHVRTSLVVTFVALALMSISSDGQAAPTGMLMADQYEIDRCYFGDAATPPGYSRSFDGCQMDGGSTVDDSMVAHQRIMCTVTYDPTEFYKSKVKRSYSAEYQYRKGSDGAMFVRIPLLSASQVMETPDGSCSLPRWQKTGT